MDGVPPEIQDSIRNVEVVVEDWPSAEVLASLDLHAEDTTLFGLYEGRSAATICHYCLIVSCFITVHLRRPTGMNTIYAAK